MRLLRVPVEEVAVVTQSFIDPDDVQERVAWFYHPTCEESDRELRERVLKRRDEVERVTGKGTVAVDRIWAQGCNLRSCYVMSMDAELYERVSGNPRRFAADVF